MASCFVLATAAMDVSTTRCADGQKDNLKMNRHLEKSMRNQLVTLNTGNFSLPTGSRSPNQFR
jgi:hypothetical protein